MIILTNKKRNTSEEQVEFGADLSPDDLDVREENELTKEQMNNANHEKQQSENTSSRRNK
ncbi:hypothetical protein ABE61_00570 [Lysinibacillus sphaericus]|uniref:hypothetical protein n=1 Tax=Lysinibacillus sphaericus TaxID=1421 RepID=UPI001DE4384E|nr:hypothetical protein [Lysinibacillus sphaericus]MBG9476994.1 hypothetical protein [Lysinibacillus sphaericus]MBG9592763.1 hypothetical protein [Lysinibacillus sphaericus]